MMRRDLLLWFAAAALAVALMAASLLFPDLSREALWLCFVSGIRASGSRRSTASLPNSKAPAGFK
jgi:hypothetical protein